MTKTTETKPNNLMNTTFFTVCPIKGTIHYSFSCKEGECKR